MMVSIDDLGEKVKIEEELKNTQKENMINTPFESSMIYFRDIITSLNILKKVKDELDVVYDDTIKIYNLSDKSSSTVINNSSNKILTIRSLLETFSSDIDDVVNKNIKEASYEVWIKKKEEFEKNDSDAEKYITDFRTYENSYNEAKNSYDTAKANYNRAEVDYRRTSTMFPQEKRRYKDKMDDYAKKMKKFEDEADRCARLCQHNLKELRTMNIYNKDLLNEYLKNSN